MLAAPAVPDWVWRDERWASQPEHFTRSNRFARGRVPLPREAPWPREPWIGSGTSTIALPIPAQNIFEIQERRHTDLRATIPLARHAQQTTAPSGKEADAIARLISTDADDPLKLR